MLSYSWPLRSADTSAHISHYINDEPVQLLDLVGKALLSGIQKRDYSCIALSLQNIFLWEWVGRWVNSHFISKPLHPGFELLQNFKGGFIGNL